MYHESSGCLVILAEAASVITLITNMPYFIFIVRESLIHFWETCLHKENPTKQEGLLGGEKPEVLSERLSKCQFVSASLGIVVMILVVAVVLQDASAVS